MVSNGEEEVRRITMWGGKHVVLERSKMHWCSKKSLDHSRLMRVLLPSCSYDLGGHEIFFHCPDFPICSQINECICLKAFQIDIIRLQKRLRECTVIGQGSWPSLIKYKLLRGQTKNLGVALFAEEGSEDKGQVPSLLVPCTGRRSGCVQGSGLRSEWLR